MGGVLWQQDALGKKEQAIYYLSKKFTDCKQRYPTLKSPQLHLQKTSTDGTNSTLANGFVRIDIIYTSHKAIKGSAPAEQLAHHPLNDHQPFLHEFLDEHIMEVEEAEPEFDPAKWKL
ncbi:hypothetical protein CR513_03704, partial [Mucuna pruriens]